MIMRYKMQH